MMRMTYLSKQIKLSDQTNYTNYVYSRCVQSRHILIDFHNVFNHYQQNKISHKDAQYHLPYIRLKTHGL